MARRGVATDAVVAGVHYHFPESGQMTTRRVECLDAGEFQRLLDWAALPFASASGAFKGNNFVILTRENICQVTLLDGLV